MRPRISRRTVFTIAATVLVTLLLVGSGVLAGVDDDINDFVGDQNERYWKNQPPPSFDWSAPRELQIQIYTNIVPSMANTWTVFMSDLGAAIYSCESKGYGLPYGASLTNPEYFKDDNNGGVTLPQPEPDGLYNNGVTTSATWVVCIAPDGANVPVYSEPNVIVFPFPVSVQDGKIVPGKGASTVTVDVTEGD